MRRYELFKHRVSLALMILFLLMAFGIQANAAQNHAKLSIMRSCICPIQHRDTLTLAAKRHTSSSNATAPTGVFHPLAPTGWNTYGYGQCTWYANEVEGRRLNGLGDAKSWAVNAAKRGYAIGTRPRLGAVVVYAPGVQGADKYRGHVAVVWQINPNGTFWIREMNRSANGGGFGRVDSWLSWPANGVTFIYTV